uniref:Uncharacterized protein n=1 Tax=Glossina brevipalpis TaxID=37001 RepID=A0A1A9WMG5_9MUSC
MSTIKRTKAVLRGRCNAIQISKKMQQEKQRQPLLQIQPKEKPQQQPKLTKKQLNSWFSINNIVAVAVIVVVTRVAGVVVMVDPLKIFWVLTNSTYLVINVLIQIHQSSLKRKKRFSSRFLKIGNNYNASQGVQIITLAYICKTAKTFHKIRSIKYLGWNLIRKLTPIAKVGKQRIYIHLVKITDIQ